MELVKIEYSLPHNPLVGGSSPSCLISFMIFMETEELEYWLSILLPTLGVIGTLIIGYFKLKKQISADRKNLDRKFKLNKDWQDSKSFLPIILCLSQNLLNLHYAFLFKGKFCPSIEAKMPLLYKNKKDNTAERSYLFFQIGMNIINDTKQLI